MSAYTLNRNLHAALGECGLRRRTQMLVENKDGRLFVLSALPVFCQIYI